MKKFVVSVLLLVYILTASGASISLHYCMGKFSGWDIDKNTTSRCSNCGMQKADKKGCCNDVYAHFQLKKDQLASSIYFISFKSTQYSNRQHTIFYAITFLTYPDASYSINSPPLKIPLYKLHRVLRV